MDLFCLKTIQILFLFSISNSVFIFCRWNSTLKMSKCICTYAYGISISIAQLNFIMNMKKNNFLKKEVKQQIDTKERIICIMAQRMSTLQDYYYNDHTIFCFFYPHWNMCSLEILLDKLRTKTYRCYSLVGFLDITYVLSSSLLACLIHNLKIDGSNLWLSINWCVNEEGFVN